MKDKALLTGLVITFIASAAAGLLEIREHSAKIEELERKINERTVLILQAAERLSRLEQYMEDTQ